MAHPASRVLGMLELLQAHHRLTGTDLAARLAVDERTVRRYAGTLAELGVPVVADRGRYGGYRLLPGFKLPPLMLTDDEAVAVVLGLVAARHLGLATETPALDQAEAKIGRVLPRGLAARLTALRETLGLTGRPRRDDAAPRTGTLLTLATAIRSRSRLTLTYASAAVTHRDFDPYGLVFHSGRWYAVGHDHRSAETRSFRADRITAATPTGATFRPPPGFDAVAHVTRQWAELPWTHEVEVLIEGDLTELSRWIPPTAAQLTEAPGGVLLRCRANDLDGVARMLAGLGSPFTVVRPDVLRDRLATHAAALASYAGRRPPSPDGRAPQEP